MTRKAGKQTKRVNRSPWELMQAQYEKSQLRAMADDDGWMDAVVSQGNRSTDEPEPLPVSPSRPDDDALVLTVAEVCALLKISRRTLERSNVPGKVKVGGSVRYHRETIEKWLRKQVLTGKD